MAEEQKDIDARTRAQAKKLVHERKAEERKKLSEQLKADYASIKDEPALADIMAKIRQFADWHLKIAKDGVGSRQTGVDEKGMPVFEDYYLTGEQRLAYLDKAAGQEQLLTYIEGKLD